MKLFVHVTLAAFALFHGTSSAFAEDGWKSLFDGETLEGWKRDDLGKAEYTAVNGTIHGKTVEGSPNTFLASEQEYGDFELEFEVKVHDQLNSGCQIRSRGKTEADLTEEQRKNKNSGLGRFHGPQVEIEASPGQSGYVYGEATGRGWLSPEPKNSAAHSHMKNGEWNRFLIVARGARIQTWINGEQIADLTDEGTYKTHPKGRIGLQVHGIGEGTGPFDVAWRNIRIREH